MIDEVDGSKLFKKAPEEIFETAKKRPHMLRRYSYPKDPCMVCLPTFTIKINQM